jgi:hypothetical protein
MALAGATSKIVLCLFANQCGALMKFGLDQEIVALENEVRKGEWSAASVFGDAPKTGAMSPERIAQQRRDWRPVGRGDIHVEVKRTRHLPSKKID